MEKVRYLKDANLNVRVRSRDLERWRKHAKKLKLTLTQLVVDVLNRQVSA